jgi:hypothetical protein
MQQQQHKQFTVQPGLNKPLQERSASAIGYRCVQLGAEVTPIKNMSNDNKIRPWKER